MSSLNGIIDDLTSGKWINPSNNKPVSIPIKKIEISKSLDGLEYDFINETHNSEKILIVSDEYTHDALGLRVFNNLNGKSDVSEFIWKKPHCSEEGVNEIQRASKDYNSIIAIGSGTINDSVKYASFLDKKKYSVFATTPMNAYTTPTASVYFNSYKKSIHTHAATGVYFDLSVLSGCPQRLTAAAFADVICRTTAQVDWLLSNILLKTPYDETPYILLGLYEEEMVANAKKIADGNLDSLALLTKISAIMGLGTFFTGTTHSGSMAEHGISHYIDMFFKDKHPGTSHGEQVGIATLSVSKIQNGILNSKTPPIFHSTIIPDEEIKNKLGIEMVNNVKMQMKNKIFDNKKTDELNTYLEKNWLTFTEPLKKVMLPFEKIWSAMDDCGAKKTPNEADMDLDLYNDALKYGRFIRDRYTILDFADDSDQLEKYID